MVATECAAGFHVLSLLDVTSSVIQRATAWINKTMNYVTCMNGHQFQIFDYVKK